LGCGRLSRARRCGVWIGKEIIFNTTMKKIFICSPLAGNVKQNIRKATIVSREIYKQGLLPIFSHAYTDIIAPKLNDNIPKERKKLMEISKEMLKMCNEIWVFGDTISLGMKEEIAYAKRNKIKIKYFIFPVRYIAGKAAWARRGSVRSGMERQGLKTK